MCITVAQALILTMAVDSVRVRTDPPVVEEGQIQKGVGALSMAGKKNKHHTVPASIEHSPLTHGEVSSVFMP